MKTLLIHIIIRLFKGKYYSISGSTETLMKVAEIAEKYCYNEFMSREPDDNRIIFYPDMYYTWCNHNGENIQFTIKL